MGSGAGDIFQAGPANRWALWVALRATQTNRPAMRQYDDAIEVPF